MGRCLLLIVVWTAIINVSFGLEMTENEMKNMKGKFCGSHLADMLSLVCDGVYNSKQKKSGYTNKINNREDYEDVDMLEYIDEPVVFPFRSREHAKSIIPVEFRKRDDPRNRGVVDECCYKACSLWEMTSYCGKP